MMVGMQQRRLLTTVLALGAASLLAACSGGDGATTTPEPVVTNAATAPASDAGNTSPATSGGPATLPAPIVSIDYEIDDTPGDTSDDDGRTTSDPQHLAELTALLERNGIVDDYDSEHDDCADEREIEVDAHLEGGDTIEIDIETCTPTPFERELIELVQSWP